MAEALLGERFCTILGGPNGSGKSTIYRMLAPAGEFVNADVTARRLNPKGPESLSLTAGRLICSVWKRFWRQGKASHMRRR